jgi:hypothetical protein
MPIKDRYFTPEEFAHRHKTRSTLVFNAMRRGVLTFVYGTKKTKAGICRRYLDITEADAQFTEYIKHLEELREGNEDKIPPPVRGPVSIQDVSIEGELRRIKPGTSLHSAKAAKEVFLARRAKLKYLIEKGELVNINDLRDTWAELGITIQKSLLAIPDRTCQLMASETDPKKIHELLSKEIRYTLQNLATDITNMAKKSAETYRDDDDDDDLTGEGEAEND